MRTRPPFAHDLARTLRRGFAGALAACGDGTQTNKAAAPGAPSGQVVLNRGNGAEPASLDPHLVTANWEDDIVGDMMMGLTTQDAKGQPIPGAAERWETSTDGLTWTFHLRDHQWSDGEPVTANDFVFAWRRILDPKTAAVVCLLSLPDQERGGDQHRQDAGDGTRHLAHPTTRRSW